MPIFNCKLVTAGGSMELYRYEKLVYSGLARKNLLASSTGSREAKNPIKTVVDKLKLRYYNYTQARNKLRRLVNSNAFKYQKKGFRTYPPVFVTLTYKTKKVRTKSNLKEFNLFIKRLNYFVFKTEEVKLKYLAISEYGEKGGALHFHFVAFNLPYLPGEKLNDLWSHGRCEIKMVRQVKNMGAYLAKYFSKGSFEKSHFMRNYFFAQRNYYSR